MRNPPPTWLPVPPPTAVQKMIHSSDRSDDVFASLNFAVIVLLTLLFIDHEAIDTEDIRGMEASQIGVVFGRVGRTAGVM